MCCLALLPTFRPSSRQVNHLVKYFILLTKQSCFPVAGTMRRVGVHELRFAKENEKQRQLNGRQTVTSWKDVVNIVYDTVKETKTATLKKRGM